MDNKQLIDGINTGIAPKSMIDRLTDIQKKAGQIKEWHNNRAYRRKNKIK